MPAEQNRQSQSRDGLAEQKQPRDKQQADLTDQHAAPAEPLPEGLQRERKGPYDKNRGRNENATQVPKP
jgi:hypothetical protein